ncbi:unnamed protein product, partial [Sphacelaria rigidula]
IIHIPFSVPAASGLRRQRLVDGLLTGDDNTFRNTLPRLQAFVDVEMATVAKNQRPHQLASDKLPDVLEYIEDCAEKLEKKNGEFAGMLQNVHKEGRKMLSDNSTDTKGFAEGKRRKSFIEEPNTAVLSGASAANVDFICDGINRALQRKW